MVVSDKIQEAKDCFVEITKSGRNNYQKYDYLETKDIFPLVRKVCKRFHMKTSIKPDVNMHCFVLTITDKEDNRSEQFYAPYPEITTNDAGKYMQDFGRCQTYAQRYLYIQAFEIAVPDEIDNKNQQGATKNVRKSKQNSTQEGGDDYWVIPEDIPENLKTIFKQIRRDFRDKVPYKTVQICNKLESMKKSKKIDNDTYMKCQKIVRK